MLRAARHWIVRRNGTVADAGWPRDNPARKADNISHVI